MQMKQLLCLRSLHACITGRQRIKSIQGQHVYMFPAVLQRCDGEGCRSRAFEPMRSTAVAVDFQKLRIQARFYLHHALRDSRGYDQSSYVLVMS